ncbi:MAG: ABC transporter permease subunit [Candidatus Kapaibacterium sp.]|nr:ABC transporter permease subunit [Bacteroidota bacterium]
MFDYFLRRLLLTIPTFIGCTLVVFIIVQLAPGGPLETQIQNLRKGGGETSGNSSIAGEQTLPPQAIEELKRFYGFDKPLIVRYLIWLGVWKREAETYNVKINERRLVGNGKSILVKGDMTIVDADNLADVLDQWNVTAENVNGKISYRVYREEYSGILTGNFGKSWTYRKPVIELIKARMPVSIQFGIIGFILSYTVCVYLGIQKALRHNSKFDFFSSTIVFIAYSIPGWALGAVILVLFCTESFFPIFPLGGFEDKFYNELSFFDKILDRAYHFVLPTIAYTMSGFASLTMLMKNSLLDNLSQDYIRTAFAKGIREKRVIWLHAMRNSIIPIGANIGYLFGVLLASNYLIEKVFVIDGIGMLTFEAILARDYPIVFCYTVISVVITLFGSIISDLVLSLIDARIRFK